MHSFSSAGIGSLLKNLFDEKFSSSIAHLKGGKTVFVASDYSGMHKRSRFYVYSILLCDMENCSEWYLRNSLIRQRYLPDGRRMAFKSLNDKKRRKALVPFLENADYIPGICITFAIRKSKGSLFKAIVYFTEQRLASYDGFKGEGSEGLPISLNNCLAKARASSGDIEISIGMFCLVRMRRAMLPLGMPRPASNTVASKGIDRSI